MMGRKESGKHPITPWGKIILEAIRRRPDLLSLRDTCRKMGLSPAYLTNVIHGVFKPSPQAIDTITTFLNLDRDELFAALGWRIPANGAPLKRLLRIAERLSPDNQYKLHDYADALFTRQETSKETEERIE